MKHNIKTHVTDNDLINEDLKTPSCKLISKFGALLNTNSHNKDSISGTENVKEKELKYPSCKLVKQLGVNLQN